MYFDYLNVLVFCAVGIVFVFVNTIIGAIVRPKRKTDKGLEVYECGEETIGEAWVQFDIRYYTVALVYVVFAVEIAFLFPWAIVVGDSIAGVGYAGEAGIGMFAILEGVVFIAILFLGLIYVWAKGDLDWVLAYDGTEYTPTQQRNQVPLSVAEIESSLAPEESDEDDADDDETEAA